MIFLKAYGNADPDPKRLAAAKDLTQYLQISKILEQSELNGTAFLNFIHQQKIKNYLISTKKLTQRRRLNLIKRKVKLRKRL